MYSSSQIFPNRIIHVFTSHDVIQHETIGEKQTIQPALEFWQDVPYFPQCVLRGCIILSAHRLAFRRENANAQ